jgi:hypothetical protein
MRSLAAATSIPPRAGKAPECVSYCEANRNYIPSAVIPQKNVASGTRPGDGGRDPFWIPSTLPIFEIQYFEHRRFRLEFNSLDKSIGK